MFCPRPCFFLWVILCPSFSLPEANSANGHTSAHPSPQPCLQYFPYFCLCWYNISTQNVRNALEAGPGEESTEIVWDKAETEPLQYNIVDTICLIVSREKWKHFIVFASNTEELTLISSSCRSSPQLLFTIDGEGDFSESLAGVYKLLDDDKLTFIVVCSTKCLLTLLHQAYVLEQETMKTSKWLVIPTNDSIQHITQTKLEIKTSDVVLLEFPGFSAHHLPSMSVRVARANVHLLHQQNKQTVLRRGGYIDRNEVHLTDDIFPGRRYGFNNKTLTVATLEFPPFVLKKEDHGHVSYSGVCMDLLNVLASKLNFSYELIEPEDKEYGQYLDGEWSGMVGLLANKNVDLAVAALTVDASRKTVMDFTVPFFYVPSGVVLKKPEPHSDQWMTLIAPFRLEVHVCIFFSLVFSTFFLFVLEEVHPDNRWTDKRPSSRVRRYGHILWSHFGALVANGETKVPNTQSGRTVLACWWLFTVICAAIYSGNLIAFLTDWRESPPFNSLAEMVQQDEYRWGTLGGSYFVKLFKTSNQSVYKKIWGGIVSEAVTDPDVLSVDSNEHLRKVLAGRYAYINELAIVEVWKKQHCNLQLMQESFITANLAFGLPKNSIHTNIFSEHILRIYESGVIDMWYEKWLPRNYCKEDRSAKRVELASLQSIFYAVAMGFALALSVLMIEVWYTRKCRERLQVETTRQDTFIQSHL